MKTKTKNILIISAIVLASLGIVAAIVINSINNSVPVMSKEYEKILKSVSENTTEILIKKTANGRVVGSVNNKEDIEKFIKKFEDTPVVKASVANEKERIAYDFAFLNKKETIAYTDLNFFVKDGKEIPITLVAEEINELVKDYLK